MHKPDSNEAEVLDEEESAVKYGELDNHLGYLVRRAQYWIFRDVNAKLSPFKLNVSRYSVLEIVRANPGISQIALAGALGIERARLVALLDDLQSLGFLVRERSAVDRRSHALHLTPLGRTAQKKANVAVAEHEKKLTKRIGLEKYQMALVALSDFRTG